jgi:hypothetical protein
MKRERLARIKMMRNATNAMSMELGEISDELDAIWDEETKELEGEEVRTDFFDSTTPSGESKPEESYPRIEDLKEGEENLILKARVAAIGKQLTGTTGEGKEWRLLTIHLNDGTSSIGLPLFNDEMDKADGLRIDDEVIVKAWKVETYKGYLQLKLGKFGTITKVSS